MKKPLLPVLFMLASGLACAADPTLAGKWKIHSSIQGYEGDLDCNLAQEGQDISGTCKSTDGSGMSVALSGKVANHEVTLQYKTMYNGDELTLVYTAKLESSEKFSGKVDVQPMGVDGEFTATSVK